MDWVTWLYCGILVAIFTGQDVAIYHLWRRSRHATDRVHIGFTAGVLRLSERLEQWSPSVSFDDTTFDAYHRALIENSVTTGWVMCCRAMRATVTPDLVVPDDLSGEIA